MHQIITGDCLQIVPTLPARSFDLIFADPPYNIGIDYYGAGVRADRLSRHTYLRFLADRLLMLRTAATRTGSLFLMLPDEWVCEARLLARHVGWRLFQWIKWNESFGMHLKHKLSRCTRHILHLCRTRYPYFRPPMTPSARQLVYNDKRANPAGRVLPDCWSDIPRLCGTHKERVPDFPTQLPLRLLRRIVRMAAPPDSCVLDPFCGSGTTGVAALENKCSFVGIDKSVHATENTLRRLEDWIKVVRPNEIEVLRFVRHFLSANDCAPSLAQVARHLGRKSASTAQRLLVSLRDQGLVTWDDGSTRTLRLTEVGKELLDGQCDDAPAPGPGGSGQ